MGAPMSLVLDWLLTLSAAAACATWLDRGLRSPRAARPALALSGWAAVAGIGQVIAVARPALAGSLGWPLSVVAGGLAMLGLSRLLLARWEATVLATAWLTLGWGLAAIVGLPDDAQTIRVVRPLVMALLGLSVLAVWGQAAVQEMFDGPGTSGLPDPRELQPVAAVLAAGGFTLAGLAGVIGAGEIATAARAGGFVALAALPVLRGELPERLGTAQLTPTRRLHQVVALAVTAAALAVQLMGSLLDGRPPGPVAWLAVGLLAGQMLLARWREAGTAARLAGELDRSQAVLAAVVEDSADVVLGVDRRGLVTSATDGDCGLLQRPAQTLVGNDLAELVPLDDREGLREVVLAITSGRRASARVQISLAPPASGTASLRLRAVPDGAMATLGDLTEAAQLRQRIVELTHHDPVTGLANRDHLLSGIGDWLGGGRSVCLLHLDLDGFKAVNDRFGHEVGDGVLREVAVRLQNQVNADPRVRGTGHQPAPLLARIGGDEFVIAVAGLPLPRAMELAEQVLAALDSPFRIGERPVRLGAGIGVAATQDDRAGSWPAVWPAVPSGTTGAADLLHRADIATEAAKRTGGTRVVVWDQPLEERARRKVDIAIELRRALDTGRLALAYQPIVRLADGVIVGVEALVRVPAGEAEVALAEVVSPAELVEVAEGSGEIDELGRWVLAEATHQAALWQQMGKDLRVGVNMSVRQLSDPAVVDAVHSALAAAHLAPDRLLIEITEGQLLGEGDRADLTIRRLQADGVSLAIDDFGSGYSSLSYLRRMPVSTVKLDRTLLGGVGSDPKATTVVRAVIGVARGLGLQVVCEGLEDLATARLLRDLGAWAGQGFALHRAMSSAELLDILDGPPVDLARRVPARPSVSLDSPVVSPVVSHHETSW